MNTVLVTGADRGIGEALCRLLHARGDHPIAACLGDSPALRSEGIEVQPGVDVRSDEAVARLAAALAGRRLDVLINNAGVVHESRLGSFRFAGFREEYEVNTLGPLRVTQALLPLMSAGGKIGIITSRVGSLGDNASGGLYGYRMSKAAANMAGICLAHDLKKRGIAVRLLHPGTVRSEMTRGLSDDATMANAVEPHTAARGLLARMDELTLETTGTFRHANGETLPW
jgi:NAD(P)-dependent dehydrogenase (short-subunit alcohol dehydrogenase family)